MSKALLEARIATLEAELALSHKVRDMHVARNHALRDALDDVLHNATCSCYEDGEPGPCPRCAVAYQEARTALTQTPAASLAAHDAEVLERAATECVVAVHAPDDMQHDPIRLETFDDAVGMCAAAIRALAAQAATHSVPDGTSEVKP